MRKAIRLAAWLVAAGCVGWAATNASSAQQRGKLLAPSRSIDIAEPICPPEVGDDASNASGAARRVGCNVPLAVAYPAGFDRDVPSPRLVVRQAGAAFLKLHFRDFEMPPGASVEVASLDGSLRHVYAALGPRGNGDFWALSVEAEEAAITVHGDPAALGRFEVDLAGVGADSFASRAGIEAASTSGVRGADDREDARCYSTESAQYTRSRSVARLRFFDHTTSLWSECTGFLVSCQSHLITSRACVPDQRTVDTLEARFNFERDACGSATEYPGEDAAGATLVDSDPISDFSVLTLAGRPAAIYEFLELSRRLPAAAERIFIPQHPAGGPKVLAVRNDQAPDGLCRVGSVSGGDVSFTCDVGAGSGGSPLIDHATGAVAGMVRPGGFGASANLATPAKTMRDRLEYQLPRCGQIIIEADKDTFIHAGNPATNYGDLASFQVGWSLLGVPGAARAFVNFNVGAIPDGADIQTAQLRLSANQRDGNAVETLNEVRRVLGPWQETMLTWNTAPAIGDVVGTYVAPVKSFFRQRGDVTDEVRRWWSGSVTNFGLALVDPAAEANADHSYAYISRGCCTSPDRPLLKVNFLSNCLSSADCDDGNLCTDDTCDAPGTPASTCVHTPAEGRPCGDGNACTAADVCDAAGVCIGNADLLCDDANPCTNDACTPSIGCTHTPVAGRTCSDGDACTGDDRCNASGGCTGGAPIVCNDANVCTDDFCNWRSGCTHVPASGRACSDGDACTPNDLCSSAGVCVGGAARSCDDGSVCTADACDASTGGCVNVRLDGDGDGACDALDNCPALSNSNQADDDDDGIGNLCDACVEIWNPDQDGDGPDAATDTCSADALFRRANMDRLEFSTDRVDGRDLYVIAACYGLCLGDPGFSELCRLPNLNLSPDGCVGGEDLHLFLDQFGVSR